MGVSFSVSGGTPNLDKFLKSVLSGDPYKNVDSAAQRGVDALRAATPADSGLTADSWSYEIENDGDKFTLWFVNDNEVNGFNIAVGLQYGHATGTGGWVEGYDYINPALKPIFDEIADNVWKEVTSA